MSDNNNDPSGLDQEPQFRNDPTIPGDHVTDEVDIAAQPDLGTEHAENAIELKEVEGLSQGRIIFRRFLRHKGAMISLVVLVLVILLAFSSVGIDALGLHIHGWWKYNWTQINPLVNGTEPTLQLWPFSLGDHPFGQDEIGRDVFAEVMRGIQQSIMIIFVIGIVSTTIGAVIGAAAGYYGGRIDSLLMRLTDMVIIVPLILLAAIVAHFAAGSGSFVLALILGLLLWTSLARLVRGEVLALREREFVEAAKVAGASNSRIMFKHILPNAAGVIIVSATLTMSAAILLEAALSYLGLGVQPPDVSLGQLMNEYQNAFQNRPWLFWWTGSFIVIIALTINFIGDGLRDAFDPRQRRLLNRKAKAAKSASREKPTTQATSAA
ncbi:ABC transporter permease [Humibacter ginsenosidimutans]|uniref:ABC transporter permease n=1 Tax=Humibacter ginsenosidimutans TaxID=2599293 RepID=A0A5B8M2L8_9MICO|nr:ABC transporter permease [Humibacter ginsenosidimutans]QDZ14381.1 ABC transporter permease [Humibacter ginsenosidimutans]